MSVRTCWFWRRLRQSAVTLHCCWPPSPLEPRSTVKSPTEEDFSSNAYLFSLLFRSQSCPTLPQHFWHKHIKWPFISWSVNVPTLKVSLVDRNTWKQCDIFDPTWGFLPTSGPAATAGTCRPSLLHTRSSIISRSLRLFLGEGLPHLCILFLFLHGRIFSSWQTWHDPRSLQKHNDSAYIYYFETSDYFVGTFWAAGAQQQWCGQIWFIFS